MNGMDHVHESIRVHYVITLEWFIEEHQTGKYKCLSDNPYYGEIKAMIDAMNCIRKYLGWETIKLSNEVSFYM